LCEKHIFKQSELQTTGILKKVRLIKGIKKKSAERQSTIDKTKN